MNEKSRGFLRELYDAAVAAAHPDVCLPPHLPEPPQGRLIILAAGKAAGAMVEAAERHYLDVLGLAPERIEGVGVTRYGYAGPTRVVTMVEAAHPVPDRNGVAAAVAALELAASAGEDDLVLVLLSGGGSALWIAPPIGVSLSDKQELTRLLLRSGATISEINTVRRSLSRIKGGRLAAAAHPARVLTLAISDVPHDDPLAIASGPTVADPGDPAEALRILNRYAIEPQPAIAAALESAQDRPGPGDPRLAKAEYRLVAAPNLALEAAARLARERGWETTSLGADLEGEARDVGRDHARQAINLVREGAKPTVLLSGGELTVTIAGGGRGGPNQEFALGLAIALDGQPGVSALAADTDGADGGSGADDDPAGAFVFPDTLERAREAGLDAADHLARNDSTTFFEGLGDLLTCGPTRTNVNDFRAVLVDTGGNGDQLAPGGQQTDAGS
ncbi:glycerate kinase type-2 family protein [Lutibaculum baratangense]|uniref:D-glycerate 2-kinase n=1 Tax=Lutibaculum baratangense AMV1 TaxID=631454 RepID=V4T997_9HYPH|nr:glycerate kinase [Lutibaculum baratangense]ESR23103.1 D-glycerate 2-kinase [Lutibaculum baratangense AMV1]